MMIILLIGLSVKAQAPDTTVTRRTKQDSLNLKHDTVTSKPFRSTIKVKKEPVYHPDSTHSPQKATIRSLIFPGLGQIYNRHGLWWRLPAIYAGLGLLGYDIDSNGKDYNVFLQESIWREHGRQGPEPLPYYNGAYIGNVDDASIYAFKDNLRRNRDLSIFAFVGVWGINIIDAYVEAKFIHSYTMDNNLSFKVTPTFSNPVYASNFNSTFTPGLKITFLLK